MTVHYNNFKSNSFIATLGVPQGSNLGPLLFLLFINDIVDKVEHSKILLYADDIKIFKTINSEEDAMLLQRDVDKIMSWSLSSNLFLNYSKCKIMSYYVKKFVYTFQYKINNFNLERIKQFKDLRVLFDEKLSFNNHIHAIVKSSYKNLGFIMRGTQCFPRISTIKGLYFAFVRSKLEYCFQVWNPIYNKYVILIEYIQRKFARYCYFKFNKQYPGFYFILMTYISSNSSKITIMRLFI